MIVRVSRAACFRSEEHGEAWFRLDAIDAGPDHVLRRSNFWLGAECTQWVPRPDLGAWQLVHIDAFKLLLNAGDIPQRAGGQHGGESRLVAGEHHQVASEHGDAAELLGVVDARELKAINIAVGHDLHQVLARLKGSERSQVRWLDAEELLRVCLDELLGTVRRRRALREVAIDAADLIAARHDVRLRVRKSEGFNCCRRCSKTRRDLRGGCECRGERESDGERSGFHRWSSKYGSSCLEQCCIRRRISGGGVWGADNRRLSDCCTDSGFRQAFT